MRERSSVLTGMPVALMKLAWLALMASPGTELGQPVPVVPRLPVAGDAAGGTLPFHLFTETLRVPFGGDWGGETFLYAPVGPRLSLGLFMRAWSEALCVSPSCEARALEAGVELRYQVKPGVDIGLDVSTQRSAGAAPTPTVLPRLRVKF